MAAVSVFTVPFLIECCLCFVVWAEKALSDTTPQTPRLIGKVKILQEAAVKNYSLLFGKVLVRFTNFADFTSLRKVENNESACEKARKKLQTISMLLFLCACSPPNELLHLTYDR